MFPLCVMFWWSLLAPAFSIRPILVIAGALLCLSLFFFLLYLSSKDE